MTRADNRPRVHIWPCREEVEAPACRWSIGPCGLQMEADTAGEALDAALRHLGRRSEVVVILEPLP